MKIWLKSRPRNESEESCRKKKMKKISKQCNGFSEERHLVLPTITALDEMINLHFNVSVYMTLSMKMTDCSAFSVERNVMRSYIILSVPIEISKENASLKLQYL